MFDLETAITDWTQSLAARESLSVDNVAELETHLRESVTSLRSNGLTDQEAFLIACRRVGSPITLDNEFAKVSLRSIWINRSLWMLIGIMLFTVGSDMWRPFEMLITNISNPFPDHAGLFYVLLRIGMTISFGLAVAAYVMIVVRRPEWIQLISRQLHRLPTWALFSLAVGLLVSPRVFPITWGLIVEGTDQGWVIALAYAYLLMSPTVLVTVGYVLHRHKPVSLAE